MWRRKEANPDSDSAIQNDAMLSGGAGASGVGLGLLHTLELLINLLGAGWAVIGGGRWSLIRDGAGSGCGLARWSRSIRRRLVKGTGLKGGVIVVERGGGVRGRCFSVARCEDEFAGAGGGGLAEQHVGAGAVEQAGEDFGWGGRAIVAVDALLVDSAGDGDGGDAADLAKDLIQARSVGEYMELAIGEMDLGWKDGALLRRGIYGWQRCWRRWWEAGLRGGLGWRLRRGEGGCKECQRGDATG